MQPSRKAFIDRMIAARTPMEAVPLEIVISVKPLEAVHDHQTYCIPRYSPSLPHTSFPQVTPEFAHFYLPLRFPFFTRRRP